MMMGMAWSYNDDGHGMEATMEDGHGEATMMMGVAWRLQ